MEYKFSVIMAAYNASRYIKPAIDSVLQQTYRNWELVIVDDGSVDDTLKIAQDYAEYDSRIKVVHQENSGTAAAARNTALQYVTGDYVQILDSDDYLSEDLLEKFAEGLNQNKRKVDIISPVAWSVNDEGKKLGEIAHASAYCGKMISGEQAFELSLNWTIHGWVCVKNELMQRIRFNPKLINGDEFTTRRLFYSCSRMIFTNGSYYYRDNQESTTKSSRNQARMYECLITDGNIYKYSISETMSDRLQKKCARKWMRSMVAHQAQYNRTKKNFEEKEKAAIEEILKNNYVQVKEAAIRDRSVFSLMYKVSAGSYPLFCKIVGVYNVAWRVKKRFCA